MKYLTIIFVLFSSSLVLAQVPITVIEGFLDVHHHEDPSSLYIGTDAGINLTPEFARQNSLLGFEAGKNSNVTTSSIFGYQAGLNSKGEWNSFFGFRSGMNSKGSDNTFFGWESGKNVRRGSGNICIGLASGPAIQDSSESGRLYIGGGPDPLIFGNLYDDLLKVNGDLTVRDQLSIADVVLLEDGDNATLRSSTSVLKPSSDIVLVSRDNIRLDLDDNNGPESGDFEIFDGVDNRILLLQENGDLTIDGDYKTNSTGSIKSQKTKQNPLNILEKMKNLNLYTWTNTEGQIHLRIDEIEFHKLLNLGEQTALSLTDLAAVNTASIIAMYELYKESKEAMRAQSATILEMKSDIDLLKKELGMERE